MQRGVDKYQLGANLSQNKTMMKLISLTELLMAISRALDAMHPALHAHQARTCLIACRLGLKLGLPAQELRQLFCAALLHDIGAIGLKTRLDLLEFEEVDAYQHAFMGAALVEKSEFLKDTAPIIAYHHIVWDDGAGKMYQGQAVPELSHLIHLSDRIEVHCHGDNVLARAQTIRQTIASESGRTFKPEYVQAFLAVSSHDIFWFELAENNLDALLVDLIPDVQMSVSLDALEGFAEFLSLVVDSRSRFTARHSSGVACAAKFLAEKMKLSVDEIQEIEIAGFLHDIGKLAIPVELLEKAAPLTPDERALMKSHVYKTYQILSKVHGLASITQIAAMHHERGLGDGYPFGMDAHTLSLSQKIMAVADVFTALAEDRPYRAQMVKAQVLNVIEQEAQSQALDPAVCACVAQHHDELRAAVVQAQQRSEAQLDAFWAYSR